MTNANWLHGEQAKLFAALNEREAELLEGIRYHDKRIVEKQSELAHVREAMATIKGDLERK